MRMVVYIKGFIPMQITTFRAGSACADSKRFALAVAT